MRIRLVSVTCTDESSEASSQDEPYAVISIHNVEGQLMGVRRFPDDGNGSWSVDEGDTVTEGTETPIYDGTPSPFLVSAAIMEQDQGNTTEVKTHIATAMQNAVSDYAGGTGWDDTTVGKYVNFLTVELAGVATNALGLGDDHVGTYVSGVTGQSELNSPRVWTFTTTDDIGSGPEGQYRLTFEAEVYQVTEAGR